MTGAMFRDHGQPPDELPDQVTKKKPSSVRPGELAMTTKKTRTPAADEEMLPRPAEELEQLAEHYDTHDTSAEMERGEWVEPQPMVTTSLRLPSPLVAALKAEARREGVRYTMLLRRVLEAHVRRPEADELTEIRERLARVERQLGGRPAS